MVCFSDVETIVIWRFTWIPFGHAFVYNLCQMDLVCLSRPKEEKTNTLIYGLRYQLKKIHNKTTRILADFRKSKRKRYMLYKCAVTKGTLFYFTFFKGALIKREEQKYLTFYFYVKYQIFTSCLSKLEMFIISD